MRARGETAPHGPRGLVLLGFVGRWQTVAAAPRYPARRQVKRTPEAGRSGRSRPRSTRGRGPRGLHAGAHGASQAGPEGASWSWCVAFLGHLSYTRLPVWTYILWDDTIFRTANMTPKLFLLHSLAGMSLGVLLGCALWLHPLAAQAGARNDGTNSVTMSPPRENPPGKDGIDYKNAQPMPLPAVPGPPSSDTVPATPSPGERASPPGSVPGSSGTGEQHPQGVMPPQPPPDRPSEHVR